jgi:hypothetical protein
MKRKKYMDTWRSKYKKEKKIWTHEGPNIYKKYEHMKAHVEKNMFLGQSLRVFLVTNHCRLRFENKGWTMSKDMRVYNTLRGMFQHSQLTLSVEQQQGTSMGEKG